MISIKENTVYINYSMLNSFLEEINDYIDYGDNLAAIYNDIIDKYYNDKNIKMYDEGKNKILEIKYDKDEANELFNNFINMDKDITVKVLFDKKVDIKNINLNTLNYKINKEDVIREKIVQTATNELGNYGGKYWKWYGLNYRMQWCCVFVSWVANENGLLNDYIPKFTSVKQGIRYYENKNQLKYAKNYKPKPGDIVFFDYPSKYLVDHVGIVEKIEKGFVYTIEGNANSDYVKRKKYDIHSPYLYAYGVPDYVNVKQFNNN
jgi:hypothetical protein